MENKKNFGFDFTVSAYNEEEAKRIAISLKKIAKAFPPDELVELANWVEVNPQAIATMKEWMIKPPPAIETAKTLLGF